MPSGHPYVLLLRSRRAYFRSQSFALYKRYVDVAIVLLALFGVALVERPALLAEPLLHFWRAPGSPAANAGWAAAWLGAVFVWVRIHRGFIAGGALATFARSLPEAVRAGPWVDAAMLLASLQLFALPVGLAAWTIGASAGGAGGVFVARAALLAALTLAVARLAAADLTKRSIVLLLVGILLLVGAGTLGDVEPALPAFAALLLGASVLREIASGPGAHAAGRAPMSSPGLRLGVPGMLRLVHLAATLIVRRHLHAALPRLGLAVAILLATLWMIFWVGKHGEAAAFVKVACLAAVLVMSGFYHLFWRTRQPIEPFVRSLPHGLLRLAAAEHLLLLGATSLLFGAAYAACLLQPAHGAQVAAHVLRYGAGSLPLLPLLGLPIIQRHQDANLLKIPILVLGVLLL